MSRLFSIEDFSNHVIEEAGKLNADMQAQEMLNEADAWAMLLEDDGAVVWEEIFVHSYNN